jgi:hypothetical protein
MDFRAILKGLGTAATNPLAFVAYLFAVAGAEASSTLHPDD